MGLNYSTVVIDGYNAIHKIEELKTILLQDIERSREKFALYLQRWKRYTHFKGSVLVFFDGQSQNYLDSMSSLHGIQFYFSYHDSDADNHIIAYLKAAGKDKRILVITDDNYIRNHCKIYHADFENVAFLWNNTKRRATSATANKSISKKKQLTQKVKNDINHYLKDKWGIS